MASSNSRCMPWRIVKSSMRRTSSTPWSSRARRTASITSDSRFPPMPNNFRIAGPRLSLRSSTATRLSRGEPISCSNTSCTSLFARVFHVAENQFDDSAKVRAVLRDVDDAAIIRRWHAQVQPPNEMGLACTGLSDDGHEKQARIGCQELFQELFFVKEGSAGSRRE